MKQLNITRILLALLFTMVDFSASAHDIEVANADGVIIYYLWENNNTELAVSFRGTYYNSYDNEYTGNVVIPESVTYDGSTYPVTGISEYAFYGCTGLTNVDIPNSVTSIGQFAFKNTAIYTDAPDGVIYVDQWACEYKGTMPDNTSIVLAEGTRGIGGHAFYRCSGLTSVDIPNSVTSICYMAFHDCTGLTSVTIPNSVTSIEFQAFYNTGIYKKAPEGVFYVDQWACGYKGTMPDNTSITFAEGTRGISSYAFRYKTGLISVTVPNSVTSIGDYAFDNCSNLSSVTIGNSVTSIGDYAFDNCSNLSSLTIGNSVTSIGICAFYGCSSMTNVTIPNSVTSIGNSAFYECTGLTSVTIPNLVTSIGDYVFYGCTGLTNITIGNSVTKISGHAFYKCTSLTSVTIPNSVTSIGERAFTGCSGLTNVDIPNSVTNIGESAFTGCSSLTSVTIPNSVTMIGEYAFSGCSGLTSVTIPNSVTSIDSFTFSACSGLTNVDIPNSVTSIGERAFSGCSGLNTITIGSSVSSIGFEAFAKTTNLTDVYCLAEKVPTTAFKVFDDSSISTTILHVPTACVEDYMAVDPWMKFYRIEPISFVVEIDGIYYKLNPKVSTAEVTSSPNGYSGEIEIPNTVIYHDVNYSVTSIGNEAFLACSSLSSVTIGRNVMTIGDNAFDGCSILEAVNIPVGVMSIGEFAFNNCFALSSITIPASVTSIGAGAFLSCSRLIAVTVFNPYPCPIVAYTFSNRNNAVLYVPYSRKSVYKNAAYWKDFQNIVEMPVPAIIDFDDENVKAICINNFDINNDGELDGDEALMVQDLGELFKGNRDITSFEELSYFTGLTKIRSAAFEGCNSLSAVIIPENVKSVGDNAFKSCYGLTSIIIPKSVNRIGAEVFGSCTSLTSFVVEEGNIIYDSREDCKAIIETATNTLIAGCKNTMIPNSVTAIGSSAFLGCFGLTSMIIPKNVVTIGESAFKYCNNLAYVSIPQNVTSIGNGAFQGCNSLTTVKIKVHEPLPIEANTFSNRRDAMLIVPIGCGTEYGDADYWKEFNPIKEVILGDTNCDWIVSIGDVTILVDYLMGNTSVIFVDDAADVDANGEITITDAIGIANIILGKNELNPEIRYYYSVGTEEVTSKNYTTTNNAQYKASLAEIPETLDMSPVSESKAYILLPEGCVPIIRGASGLVGTTSVSLGNGHMVYTTTSAINGAECTCTVLK
ncbi:MAG: leucine-rich repeat protein [Prevotella sp.]|nr:leucine-rich repeat protein [Prevotella sp.]